jgi:outer membrane protein assembly factor BamB
MFPDVTAVKGNPNSIKSKKEMKSMKEHYYKTKLSTIALILVLTLSATLVALPDAFAQEFSSKKTYAYIGAVPNPVGVKQEVLLHIGISDQLSSVEMGWEDLSVTIERPDGGTDTITDIRTDATGGTGRVYVPDMAGTYYLQTHFPTQTIEVMPFFSGNPYNMTYLASSSEKLELEVLDEKVPQYPGHSLPNQYWTRPIDAQLREWNAISGSWLVPSNLMSASVWPDWIAPYNDGPEAAHILWTKPLTIGGLAGGETGEHGFDCGDAYEGKWGGSLIVSGMLYYTMGGSRGLEPVVTHCVDIHTGKELWSKVFLDNASVSFGQLLYWTGVNYHGVFAYLYVSSGSNWYVYDAYSGDWRFTIENVPSGTTLFGPNGEIYISQVNVAQGWMGLWNATALCLSNPGADPGSWGNSVHMQTFDAATTPSAWSVNATIPTDLPGTVRATFYGDKIIGSQNSLMEVTIWGLNLNSSKGNIGAELFRESWDADPEWVAGNVSMMGMSGGWVALSPEVGVIGVKELCAFYGFSFETGKYLWGPTDPHYYLDQFFGDGRLIAYGRFYSTGVSGTVYCYNATTGKLLWTYPADDPYQEFLFGNNWWTEPMFVTDGKLYVGHAEHSPIDPKPRGAPFICLNATDGSVIWRADGLFRQTHWGGLAIIGDSIIACMDTYDQRIYGIGKGASKTTVTATPKVTILGRSIVIEGTVMDVSPGTEDSNLKMRFPNGVPAISDEDMTEWMLHVYKQFECPDDVEGVEVFLKIRDPNGDWYSATVTTDSNGMFSHMWAPGVVGEYHVTAMFEGSESYYASEATTVFGVDKALVAEDVPSAAEIAECTADRLPAYLKIPEIPAYLTIDVVILVIAAVGVVIGLIAYMSLRKQK